MLSRQSGFTLIEIMVVVFIIAIMSVVITLSLSDTSDRSARLQANRFMSVVNEVRDEAVIAGQDYALIVDEKSQVYSFRHARGSRGGDISGDVLFKDREVDPDVDVKWQVFESFTDDDDALPTVLISSLGEITPFEMSFGGKKLRYTIFLNDEGQLQRRDQQGRL